MITIDMPTASDIGSYSIELEANFVDNDQTKIQTSFSVEVISEESETMQKCREDEIVTDFSIDTISYQIG